jgi:hypothetical protein
MITSTSPLQSQEHLLTNPETDAAAAIQEVLRHPHHSNLIRSAAYAARHDLPTDTPCGNSSSSQDICSRSGSQVGGFWCSTCFRAPQKTLHPAPVPEQLLCTHPCVAVCLHIHSCCLTASPVSLLHFKIQNPPLYCWITPVPQLYSPQEAWSDPALAAALSALQADWQALVMSRLTAAQQLLSPTPLVATAASSARNSARHRTGKGRRGCSCPRCTE